MRLVNGSIERVPNNQIEMGKMFNKDKAPEVYRIGLIADGTATYYGVFIDRKSRRTYALKYKVDPSRAMNTSKSAVVEDILEDDEWAAVITYVNKYKLIEHFEIYEKKLMMQWFFQHNGKAYLQRDLYTSKYRPIKDKEILPNGTPVVTYDDGDDLIDKIDENNKKDK